MIVNFSHNTSNHYRMLVRSVEFLSVIFSLPFPSHLHIFFSSLGRSPSVLGGLFAAGGCPTLSPNPRDSQPSVLCVPRMCPPAMLSFKASILPHIIPVFYFPFFFVKIQKRKTERHKQKKNTTKGQKERKLKKRNRNTVRIRNKKMMTFPPFSFFSFAPNC